MDELMSIDDAVEALQSSRSSVYRWLRTGELKGVKVGRQWRVHPDEIERFLRGEAPTVEGARGVDPFLDELRELLAELGAEPSPDRGVMATVATMAQLAAARGATQFALEPHLGESNTTCGWFRMRVDGVLDTVATATTSAVPPLIEGWKRWSGCDPHRKNEIQHGRAVLTRGEHRRPIDLRITFIPTVLGESVSVTVLDQERAAEHINLDRLDHYAEDRARIDEALESGFGTIVVTGPSGSGKSTLLYACLHELAGPQRTTIAIEDPVEWRVPGVLHIGLNPDDGVTFAAATRAAMHCDPDVLMVSEIRDAEMLELVPSIALVGHLVLTALHAPAAVDALMRMAEFGLERHTIAEGTRLVVAQQLIRRLCPDCAVPHRPTPDELDRIDAIAQRYNLDLGDAFHHAVGCRRCTDTGYRGRRVIAETVQMTDALRSALLEGASADGLWDVAVADGSTSIVADGLRRAAMGETSLDEVWRIQGMVPEPS